MMRSLILAGAALTAFATSANAWTQSILHPEGQGTSAAVTLNSVTPRYTIFSDGRAGHVATIRRSEVLPGVSALTPFADDSVMIHGSGRGTHN